MYYEGVIEDITERKRMEEQLNKEYERTKLLLELHLKAPQLTDKALYDYVLDKTVSLTGSTIGFFHRVSDDQKTIILTTWNEEALKNCTASYETHYSMDEAGNWVDCVHYKRPIIYNDFPNSPNQKGLPEGHVPIKRFMSIPVVEADKVRLIFGVGNKPVDYDEQDVSQIQLVAEELHKIITRRRMQEALRESEERFRDLFENSNDLIQSLRPDGSFEYVNPAWMNTLGYNEEDISRMTLFDIIHQESQDHCRLAYQRVLAGEKLNNIEAKFVAKDGRTITVDGSSVCLFKDGKPVATRGIFRDVTERKKLEEQFRQAQKMEGIGRLAGGVAHDFNNLLTVISGHADLALMELDPNNPLRDDLDEIMKATGRASDLTRQLLAFSRRQTLMPRVLNLNDIIVNLDKMLRRIIGEDIDLITKTKKDLWNVKADPGQIDQVIINLAVNARDAMPHGGKLTIETQNVELDEQYAKTHANTKPGPHVMLAISDSGTGISDDVREHIFDPFFTTKGEGKGTGLGLSTVYGIVKQSGGNIWVYSELGKGTTFKVYLPMVEAEAEEFAREERAMELPRGLETILVVEDEEGVRKLACRILKQLGYEVLEAPTGDDAYQLCAKLDKPIDLIITDVVMPTLSGAEFVDKLRNIWSDFKVLYMSGYTSNAIVHHGVLDPSTPYMQKPFRPVDIAWKVRRVLDE